MLTAAGIRPPREEGPLEKPAFPRPIRVYEIPARELAYWDALDDRVSCADCGRGSSDGVQCPAKGRFGLQEPHHLKHWCQDFRMKSRRV